MRNGILYIMLYPVSLIYACITGVRNLFFDVRLFRTNKLSVPVVSVGNITTGGTGKTPAVMYIARMLQSDGHTVGIISRGYKRSSRGYVVVSDGARIFADARKGGDEPVMLAHSLPGVVVAVDEKRYRGGKFLIEDYGVDVIVMDDGFQHRALSRDLDIVLINASRPDHLRAHLPAGRLRERLRSLRRADLVIMSNYNGEEMLRSTEQLLRRYTTVPVVGSGIKPVDCIDVVRNSEVPIQSVVTKKAYLFTGIAEPGKFRRTVNEAGITIGGMRDYPDHYHFNERDMDVLFDEARRSGADLLLTTEKDAVRLHPYKHLFNENIPLYALKVSFTMTQDDNKVLEKYLYRMMNKYKRSITMN